MPQRSIPFPITPVDLQPGTRSIAREDFAGGHVLGRPWICINPSENAREPRNRKSRIGLCLCLCAHSASRVFPAREGQAWSFYDQGRRHERWFLRAIGNEPWTGDLWRTNGRGISCFIYGPMHGRRSTGNMFIPAADGLHLVDSLESNSALRGLRSLEERRMPRSFQVSCPCGIPCPGC